MPHQFARITIRFGTVQDAVIVPVPALLERPDGSSVAYVVEDGKAVQRVVEVGIQQPVSVQVISGIEAGDKVVVTGNENLKDGMAVRLAGAKGQGQEPGGASNKGKTAPRGTSDGGNQ